MVSQQCLCLDSISACPDITFYYCILFLFLPRWVMSIEIKKEKQKRRWQSVTYYLYRSSIISCSQCYTVCRHIYCSGISRFSVILHLLAGITSRLCKEPPSGACYQSCMFSLHLPSLPPWLVDKFFGCTCFHGLIVSTDLQQNLC